MIERLCLHSIHDKDETKNKQRRKEAGARHASHLFIILQHWHPIWPAESWSCGGTLRKQLNFNHTNRLRLNGRQNRKRQIFFGNKNISFSTSGLAHKGKVTVGSADTGLRSDTPALTESEAAIDRPVHHL